MDFRITLFSGSPPCPLEVEVIRAFPDVSFSQETFDFLRNGMSLVNLSDVAYFLGVAIIGFTRMRDVSMGDAAFLSDFLDYLDVNGRTTRMSENQLIAASIAEEKILFQEFPEDKKKVVAKFLTAIKDGEFFEFKEDAIKSALEFWKGQRQEQL